MKKIIFAFCMLLTTGSLMAQEHKIVELLNAQLEKEISDYPNSGDSLAIIQPFRISKDKILSFEVVKFNAGKNEKEWIRREVSLDGITAFNKDINVVFVTRPDAVTITTKKPGIAGESVASNTESHLLFFTEISKEKDNEDYRDKMLRAFDKAGYEIKSEVWAD